jgi:RmlD substrate binding domain
MKIAITGHTAGIGQALYKEFQERGHVVSGFSRTNGYDISKPDDINKIITESADADLFVNNAHHGFSQTTLLYDLAAAWRSQHKTIVCIGSSLTGRWITSHKEYGYRTYKIALDHAIEHLQNMQTWPRICRVRPGTVYTQRSDWGASAPAGMRVLSAEEFAVFLADCLLKPNLFIQDIWINGLVPDNYPEVNR